MSTNLPRTATIRPAAMDAVVARAASATAKAMAARAVEITLEKTRERPHFHDAFRQGLRRDLGSQVLAGEKRLRVSDWEGGGRLGGFDVICEDRGAYTLLAELKWCHSKGELGWTLWDIFKLVAAKVQYRTPACYAVVGAPRRYWQDSTIDCAALYFDGVWESAELFDRYRRAWIDLLRGGSARPTRVPSSIETRLVAETALGTAPEWLIRVISVDVAGESWLPFDGDWPRGTG